MNPKLILGIILVAPLAIIFLTATVVMIVGAVKGDKDFQGMLFVIATIGAFFGGVALIAESLL